MNQASTLRRYRVECLGAASVVVLWVACLVLKVGGEDVTPVVSNAGQIVAPAAAGICCLHRAFGVVRRYRWFWVLLGLSALFWSGGQTIWTWYESVLGREAPFPSFADFGYLAAVPLAAAALMTLPLAARTFVERVRQAIDGLMVASSLLLLSWVLLLRQLFADGGDELLTTVISLSYPIGDIVVVTILAFAVAGASRGNGRREVPLGLVGAGLLAISCADSAFTYLNAVGSYLSGAYTDSGWFVGYVLIMLAARKPLTAGIGVKDDERVQWAGLLVPYLAVICALAVEIAQLVHGRIDIMAVWLGLSMMGMLVGRQVLTLVENLTLASRLEARVLARTAELAASEQRFHALVQHSAEAVIVLDADATVRYVSESMRRVFGYGQAELMDQPFTEVVEVHALLLEGLADAARVPYSIVEMELPIRHSDGHPCTAQVTITNLIQDSSVGGLVLNIRDISERKRLEDKLVHQAFHDSLTTLANRALFKDRLQHALHLAQRRQSPVVVLFLDLDGFKEVNDTLGHAVGDALLVEVAERLRSRVRPGDTIARLGGDEFAVLIEDAPSELDVDLTAERLLDGLREPFVIDGREIQVRASVGIASAYGNAEDADELLRNADLAMYGAKATGSGGFVRYDPAMHVKLIERVELEADLRRALEKNQLLLHYQPTFELNGGRLVGTEALIRWAHPDRGLVPPNDFIPLAEATGLIEPIGAWVLRTACAQAAAWQRAYPADSPPVSVNVNVSIRQLQSDQVVRDVEAALADSGLPASSLVLELTESILLLDNEDAMTIMRRLKQIGVGLAIDDFGTGYSSLSYLHRFPVDTLKIDRSFVDRLTHSVDHAELVRTVVTLGRTLRLKTVAEGIETREQLDALREMGCDVGQGYYFARPMPPADLGQLLAGSRYSPAPR